MSSADRHWWRRYDRYLNSQGWKLTREVCFRRDGYRCRRCGLAGSSSNPLQAAHLTYENYDRTGSTPAGDLRTLCRHCHEITTGQKFHQRAFSHWLWQWWWRLTLRQKAVLVVVAWLALVLIQDMLMPVGQLRPVSTLTPGAAPRADHSVPHSRPPSPPEKPSRRWLETSRSKLPVRVTDHQDG